MRTILAAILTLGLVAAAAAFLFRSELLDWRASHLSETAVRELLRDPESAIYRHVTVMNNDWDEYVVCGYVNGKNAFGGYGEFRNFIATPTTTTVRGDEDTLTFDTLWLSNCGVTGLP